MRLENLANDDISRMQELFNNYKYVLLTSSMSYINTDNGLDDPEMFLKDPSVKLNTNSLVIKDKYGFKKTYPFYLYEITYTESNILIVSMDYGECDLYVGSVKSSYKDESNLSLSYRFLLNELNNLSDKSYSDQQILVYYKDKLLNRLKEVTKSEISDGFDIELDDSLKVNLSFDYSSQIDCYKLIIDKVTILSYSIDELINNMLTVIWSGANDRTDTKQLN